MANFFRAIVKGLDWVGVHFVDIFTSLPKLIKAANNITTDASTLIPDLAIVLDDCDKIVAAGIEDSGAALTAIGVLVSSITTAASQSGLNIASDSNVVTAFEAFIKDVTTKSNFKDVLTAYAQLVIDFDNLKTTINTDIAQIEADIATK